jgi:hypothetical protein
VALALCAELWASATLAQSASTVAEALFEQGRDAARAHDYDTACARFRESNRLDPAVGTLFNLASCEEQRGKLATAWELYRGTLEQLPNGDTRVEIARERLAALEPRLPHLTIRLAPGAPASTVVTRGTFELQGASLGVPLPVDPGRQELRVRAPGSAERSYSVDLREGQSTELAVGPGESAPAPVAASRVEPASAHQGNEGPASGAARRSAGYVVGGVGITAVGVGVVASLLALHQKSTSDAHCSDALRLCDAQGKSAADRGRTLGALGGATLIGGGVALALGSYLVLSSPSEPKHSARAKLVVAWLPGVAQLGAEGAW